MESNYGEILKNDKVMRNVVRSLATLAYADKRRAKFARTQLIAALKILQTRRHRRKPSDRLLGRRHGPHPVHPDQLPGLCGRMDGNGKRDIWNSIPDALATAANLLKKNGWQAGKTWGYEVACRPANFPSGSKSLSQWQALGVARANGKPFKNGSDKAELKVPDGRGGPAFLMTKNFFVIKRYNNADKYALAVGLLADEIAGYGGLVQDWKRPFTKLTFEEKQELQKRLSTHGYYDGKFDGKIGDGSKAAIKAFQAQAGLTPGRPSEHGSAEMAQEEIEPAVATHCDGKARHVASIWRDPACMPDGAGAWSSAAAHRADRCPLADPFWPSAPGDEQVAARLSARRLLAPTAAATAESRRPSIPRRRRKPPQTSARQSRSQKRPRAPRRTGRSPIVEKTPDARVVLVVGDFLASGLAEGLTTAFADNAGVRIVDRTNGSSGFVRDDCLQLAGERSTTLIDAEKPAAVVVMLGANDRQQMRVDDERETAALGELDQGI